MARPYREPRPPHPGFFQKPKLEKRPPLRLAAAAKAADPYKDGRLRIFLDDDRACPPGWTLVKCVADFEDLLAACPPANLAGVALDWYLGHAVAGDGHEAAAALIRHIEAAPAEFTALEAVYCHSSVPEEAAKMARAIAAAILRNEDMPDIDVRVGSIPQRRS
ncbi:cyclic-phosphate processing receiver domain-containing protein [Sphingosinicella sp. BN140058]|uniref:cyclic-phosphate processing receiver domain-containing protein n=1 Tax=Sphingosinicella sp. BN140058 TaxID=1892855 RepID=UPI001010F6F0|nr:cyclic-phosphate processing receiver domain-containing protein [Sphingosinicella sp. BN140058]QAY80242.1 hypothetical protein ETR14_26730 [Sphingosinicella sp. BN140058]